MDKDCMASPGAKIVAIALYYIVHALQMSTTTCIAALE